jgi:hypothetical protein
MLVQAASCYPETSCAFDGNVTAGNLLVVFAGSFATNDATISSTAGRCTTWTSLPALNTDPFDGGGTAGVKAFYCRVATTGAATISLASCGPDCGLTMAEFNSTTGWSATPLEVSAYKAADAEDTGTANVGPQTVSANDLLVAYYLDETATQGTISAGPGYILGPKNEGHADAFAYRTNAPSGSYGASLFTTTVSYRYWLAYFLAFRVN